jgi:hypothetical protein
MEGNARMERKVKREEQRLMELRQRAKPTTPTTERDPEFFTQRLNTLSSAYPKINKNSINNIKLLKKYGQKAGAGTPRNRTKPKKSKKIK